MFLSHTSDLRTDQGDGSYIAAAEAAVTLAGHAISDMAYFAARDSAPSTTCASAVRASDVYVAIIGLRYGTVVRDRPDLSYTQLEFETATEHGIPRLVFLVGSEPISVADGEFEERQLRFRRRLQDSDLTTTTVHSPADLKVALLHSLVDLERASEHSAPAGRDVEARRYWRSRQDLLHQVRDLAASELEPARGQLPWIQLAFETRPSAVTAPIESHLRRPERVAQRLPRTKRVSDIFRESGRQLLILGQPGAGKTCQLCWLATELVDRALTDPSEPMPVLYHLSSWADTGRPLAAWLADELHQRYGVAIGLAHAWVEQDLILPLLDGLDEVALTNRGACAAAITAFQRKRGQAGIAVCSRLDQYEAIGNRLRLRHAVNILPLERDDVGQYLGEVGPPGDRLRTALRDDPGLWELLVTPLFLGIVSLTYGDVPAWPIDRNLTLEARRAAVLTDYVRKMLDRPQAATGPEYDRGQLLRWLGSLASTMHERAQSVHYPDLIQPDWLRSSRARWLVRIGLPASIGVLMALIAAVVLTPRTMATPFALGYVLIASVALGLGLAAVVYQHHIVPTEQLGWSTRRLRQQLPSGVRAGLLIAPLFAAAFSIIDGTLTGVQALVRGAAADAGVSAGLQEGALIFGLVLGNCVGVCAIVVLTSGIDERYAIDPPTPGSAITASKRNGLVAAFTIGAASAGMLLFATQRLEPWLSNMYLALSAGRDGGISFPAKLLLLGPGTGLIGGLAVGLLVRLTLPVRRHIRLRRGVVFGLLAAAVVGPVQLGLMQAVHAWGLQIGVRLMSVVPQLHTNPRIWPFVGTLAGLIVALGGSRRHGAIAALVAAIAAGSLVPLTGAVALFTIYPPSLSVLLVLTIVLAVGIRHGGGAFLRHHLVLWLLARAGAAPRSYLPFLEHASRLNFLRRRGGGYEFIHGMLLDHFRSIGPVSRRP